MDSEIRNELFTLLREVNDAETMKDSQLRDCIDELEEALQAAAVEPEPGLSLDAVEAMLLSDEVVVAAGDVIAGEFYADLPMMTGEAYSQVAKAALQAALAVAKGTEGSA